MAEQTDDRERLLEEIETLTAELAQLREAKATSDLQARLDDQASAHAAEIAEVTSALEAAQAAVVKAEAEAEVARKAYSDLIEFLEGLEAEEARKAELSRLAEERAAAVKALGAFSDEFIAPRKDEWASLDADVFEVRLAEYSEIASCLPKRSEGADSAPSAPAFASREIASQSKKQESVSVYDLNRLTGFDVRSITR